MRVWMRLLGPVPFDAIGGAVDRFDAELVEERLGKIKTGTGFAAFALVDSHGTRAFASFRVVNHEVAEAKGVRD